jgi:hypothetical protein
VLDVAQRADYQQQIAALRARALLTPEPSHGPSAEPGDRGKGADKRPTPKASRTAPQQQRGQQGGQESGQELERSSGTTTSGSNRDGVLPDLPLPATEEHGAPRR